MITQEEDELSSVALAGCIAELIDYLATPRPSIDIVAQKDEWSPIFPSKSQELLQWCEFTVYISCDDRIGVFAHIQDGGKVKRE